MDKSDFTYIYSPYLKKWLTEQGIRYNCTGENIDTHNRWWQYTNSQALSDAINVYRAHRATSSN